MNDALIQELLDAGTPPMIVMKVAMEFGRLLAERDAEAKADRRSPAAIKQQRYRDRLKTDAPEHRVTEGNDVTNGVTRYDEGNGASSLDKETSPRPPKEINLISGECCAPAREADPEPIAPASDPVRMDRLVAISQVAVAMVLDALHRRRWKNMPPPADVTAEQWKGFLDHRKAKRHTLTDRAYELLCGKLAKHADPEWPPGRIIDTIVDRQWLSFEKPWLLKISEQENGNGTQHRPQQGSRRERPSAWAPQPGFDGFEPASLDDD